MNALLRNGTILAQARRTLRNVAEGNPFATPAEVRRVRGEVEAAYFACRNVRTSNLLKVELDRLDDAA